VPGVYPSHEAHGQQEAPFEQVTLTPRGDEEDHHQRHGGVEADDGRLGLEEVSGLPFDNVRRPRYREGPNQPIPKVDPVRVKQGGWVGQRHAEENQKEPLSSH